MMSQSWGLEESITTNELATTTGKSVRTIQRIIAKYEEELSEHIDRRGKKGTWLDSYAIDFIKDKMKTNPVQHVTIIDNVELQQQLLDAQKDLLNEKERIIQLQEQINILNQQLQENKKQQLLITTQTNQIETQEAQIKELQEENQSYKKTFFGLYRKIKK